MRTILILVGIYLISLMSACKQSDNGEYVIYSIVPQQYSNDTATSFINNTMQGTKYEITFHDKYASMKSLKTGEEYILAKETIHFRYPTYSGEITKPHVIYNISLVQDTALLLSVRVALLHPVRTYYDSNVVGRIYNDAVGNATCHLSKVDD